MVWTRYLCLARTALWADGPFVYRVVCSRYNSFYPACLFVARSSMKSLGVADRTAGPYCRNEMGILWAWLSSSTDSGQRTEFLKPGLLDLCSVCLLYVAATLGFHDPFRPSMLAQ